jgi:2-iminobutanoate/2-iminopropanoate deaminase
MSVAMGPYSPIVTAGSWLICSGQLGLAPPPEPPLPGPPPAPVFVEGGAAEQLTEALANAEILLRGHGATRAEVVKTTVFLTDMADAPSVNEAYAAFFGDHRPARSMVAVAGLPLGALVEVEVWAYREPG